MDLSRQASLLKRSPPPVMVIGAGATGFHVAQQLLGLGCPHIEIWDGDTIEESNLNRQLYGMEGIGENKASYLVSLLERAAHGNEEEQQFVAQPRMLEVFTIESEEFFDFPVVINTTDNLYHHGSLLRKFGVWLKGGEEQFIGQLYISPRMSAFDAEVFAMQVHYENPYVYFHTLEEWKELERGRASCTAGSRPFNPAIITTSVLTAAMAVQQLVNHLNEEPVAQWIRMDLETFKIEASEFYSPKEWVY